MAVHELTVGYQPLKKQLPPMPQALASMASRPIHQLLLILYFSREELTCAQFKLLEPYNHAHER